MREVTLENGTKAWLFSSFQYVQTPVQNHEKYLKKKVKKFPPCAVTPIGSNYRPGIDFTPELNPKDAAYYQSLIGVLICMVELGRVNICCEVLMMSSSLALPRSGHMEQLYHIFSYLRKHHNIEIVFDPTEPTVDEELFVRKNWTDSVYTTDDTDLKEALPSNMSESRSIGLTMRAYVDADHAGDPVTCRARTGFLIHLNSALAY